MSLAIILRSLLIGLILAGIGAVIAHWSHFTAAGIEGWVDSFGAWAPLLFIAGYGIATLFLIPATLFTLAGGALFGPLWGSVYSLLGAELGAVIGLLIARYVASDWIAAHAGPRLARIMEGAAEEGWRFVAFTRLVPIFPFMPQNYLYGLSRIGLGEYALATLIFMIPSTIAYTWLGHIGMEAASGRDNWVEIGLLGLAAVVLILFLPRIVRFVRTYTRRDSS
jgi:uncharacterized membrane protein YdjX (TVP38/TMEM64 family)